jgi:acetyltransferase EpsM
MIPLVIIGAGGHGAEVAAYAQSLGLPLLGALDDGQSPGPWCGTQLVGGIADLPRLCQQHEQVHYITAFGNNELRQKIVKRVEDLSLPNLSAFTLRHESAWSGFANEIGAGTLLAPNTLITARARIGEHCILNVRASVSHDCVVADWCNLNPGSTLCGNVELGEGCYVGAGATVIEKRKIGAWTIIGAGAVVTQDLPPGVVAVGVPAKVIRTRTL